MIYNKQNIFWTVDKVKGEFEPLLVNNDRTMAKNILTNEVINLDSHKITKIFTFDQLGYEFPFIKRDELINYYLTDLYDYGNMITTRKVKSIKKIMDREYKIALGQDEEIEQF